MASPAANLTFQNNSARYCSGAVCFKSSMHHIGNALFVGNGSTETADGDAIGMVDNRAVTLTLTNVTFA